MYMKCIRFDRKYIRHMLSVYTNKYFIFVRTSIELIFWFFISHSFKQQFQTNIPKPLEIYIKISQYT